MTDTPPIPSRTETSETGPRLRRFNLITGKGGVGKSTVVATLGLRAARTGRKTLLIELNSGGQVAQCFGAGDGAGEIQHIEHNLWHVNIEPMLAMREYGLMKLKFDAAYRLVFDNPIVRALVDFMPGLNDLLMLGKAFNHERELNSSGDPTWDCIIVDAPATGHSLTFFRLPKMIRDVVPAGNMHQETDMMWALLCDKNRTIIHLVTLAEELPVQETMELCKTLDHTLKLPVGSILVNRCPTVPFDQAAMKIIQSKDPQTLDGILGPIWTIARSASNRHEEALHHINHLAGLGHPIYTLPELIEYELGRSQIETLANRLES